MPEGQAPALECGSIVLHVPRYSPGIHRDGDVIPFAAEPNRTFGREANGAVGRTMGFRVSQVGSFSLLFQSCIAPSLGRRSPNIHSSPDLIYTPRDFDLRVCSLGNGVRPAKPASLRCKARSRTLGFR